MTNPRTKVLNHLPLLKMLEEYPSHKLIKFKDFIAAMEQQGVTIPQDTEGLTVLPLLQFPAGTAKSVSEEYLIDAVISIGQIWSELTRRNSFFESAGAIGAGKSTAVKILRTYSSLNNLEEIIRPEFYEARTKEGTSLNRDDLMLMWLYSDLEKYAVFFNACSSLKRTSSYSNALSLLGLTGSDRSIFEDDIFMDKYESDELVTPKEANLVRELFRKNIRSLRKFSDFIIYMACGTKELVKRAEKRDRESERKGRRILMGDEQYGLWAVRDEGLREISIHAPEIYEQIKHLACESVPQKLELRGLDEEYLDSLNNGYGYFEGQGIINILNSYGYPNVFASANSERFKRTDLLHVACFLDYLATALMTQKFKEGFGFEYCGEASDRTLAYVAPERVKRTSIEVPVHHQFC